MVVGTHGDQGAHSREDKDEGCFYSEGNPCRYCPFIKCIEELDNGDRVRFGRAFRKNDAIEWRLFMWQIQSAIAGEDKLLTLLQLRWEPFAVTPDGEAMRVWLRKNPIHDVRKEENGKEDKD